MGLFSIFKKNFEDENKNIKDETKKIKEIIQIQTKTIYKMS